MKIFFIFLTLLCLLYIGCNNSSSQKEDTLATQNLNDKMVIILDSVPDTQVKILANNGMFSLRNMCSYINDDFEEVSFLYPEQFNVNDTIEINTIRILMYRYNDIDCYYFDKNNYSVSLMHNALADENINLKLNKTVVSKFLDQVFAETTWDIIKRNSEEYLNIYPESELPDFLMTKYNIDSTTVNDVVLEDVDGRKTTLDKVLNELHGKDVILDVWASWCAPCIHKIETGKEEREENKEKGVEYVFITYFDKKSDWLKKIDELGLKSEKYCYFTTNSKTSKWFKDMKISFIPCIITYNKTGKVVGFEN